MEIKKLIEKIENEKVRSAWARGCKKYAIELVKGANVETVEEVTLDVLLNGASNWTEFSYGGCSLVYNSDICERLSNPTEQRKQKGGDNPPNHLEDWLTCQARALYQASRMVLRLSKTLLQTQNEEG